MTKYETPLLDDLEKGSWPSFVTEIKKSAKSNKMANAVLGQLEKSYRDKIGYWKHGGIVGVMGYGGGVIGRYSALGTEFPDVAHFHTIRVNQPSGWFYDSKVLRTLCDIWDEHGSGLTNMHGSTGDMILLGCRTEALEPIFAELTKNDFDLGGSGSCVRTPSCCVGQARCEWACYDTMDACHQTTMKFQDELHRPPFPYKWKFKFSGCSNDCVASIARSDMSVIGTWRDEIQVKQDALAGYEGKIDIQKDVVNLCPANCMEWDGKELDIDDPRCFHCMHCINVLPKALKPGKDRGATILLGAKAPIMEGALLSSVVVPFIKFEGDEPYEEFWDVAERMMEVWAEEGKNRERVGEFIQRVGLGNFLEAAEVEPVPQMVSHPRDNPYIFFEEVFEEDDEEEEDDE